MSTMSLPQTAPRINYKGNFPGPKEPPEPEEYAPTTERIQDTIESLATNHPEAYVVDGVLDEDTLIGAAQIDLREETNSPSFFWERAAEISRKWWNQLHAECAEMLIERKCSPLTLVGMSEKEF